MTILDHRQNRVDAGRPNGLFVGRLCPHYVVGQPCPHHVLFGHDDDVDRLTVPSRQRLRQFPEKNDVTTTRAPLHHRRVKAIIRLSVFVTPLVCIRHPDCPLISVSRQSARSKSVSRVVYGRSGAHTLTREGAAECNR